MLVMKNQLLPHDFIRRNVFISWSKGAICSRDEDSKGLNGANQTAHAI